MKRFDGGLTSGHKIRWEGLHCHPSLNTHLEKHPDFGSHVTTLNHGLFSQRQGKQRRETLGTTILDKLNGTLRPPLPPKSVMGKWRVLAFTHLHPWFGGEGAFLFHFILSKIVYEPLLGVTSSIWGNHDTNSALVRSSKVTSSESTSPIQKINWARRHWKKTKCKWHFTLT